MHQDILVIANTIDVPSFGAKAEALVLLLVGGKVYSKVSLAGERGA